MTRRGIAIAALALGGFAIGCSEFVAIGLLPEIAADFWPTLAAARPAVADAHAAQFVSVYALGVVLGGPVLGAFAARTRPRPFLVLLLLTMTLGTALTALMPGFRSLLVFRLLAAIPHAAFFGVAAIEAAQLMGEGHHGRGVGLVLGGLSLANVIGVPLATWLGHATSWRICYGIIAFLFLIALAGVLYGLPRRELARRVPLRRSLAVFGRARVRSVLVMGAVVAAGLFTLIAYVAPILVDRAGVSPGRLPWLLVILGTGMVLGNTVGGVLADIHLRMTMWTAFLAAWLGLITLVLWIGTPVGATAGLALLMFAMGAVSPFTQLSLMNAAGDNRSMGGALNSSCMNLGNSAGAVLGGLAIASSLGYSAAVVLGAALVVAAFLIAANLIRREDRTRRRDAAIGA